MVDLLAAIAAVAGVLLAAYFVGKKRKQEALARVMAEPECVARLYLRQAPEIDAYWLHAEMKNGKKTCLAAPWEIVDTLKRLGALGLCLSQEDEGALGGVLAAQSVRFENNRESAEQRLPRCVLTRSAHGRGLLRSFGLRSHL